MLKYHYSLLVLLFYFMLKLLGVKCAENSNAVKLEDIIVDYVNTTYFDEDTFDISIIYNTDSDNTMRIRFEVIHELPPEIFIKIKVLGRTFGQYKVPTGISVDINICDGQLKKFFLEQVLLSIGVTECPPKKGVYGNEEFSPTMSGLPLYALPGFHLLVDSELYSNDIILMKIKSFLHIS